MDARDIAVIVLLVALAGFAVAYVTVGPGRRRRGPRPLGDIPLALRPYHADEELESRGLERAMSWGFAMVIFIAFFLPVYWLLEPERINEKQFEFFENDVEAGRLEFASACAQCHGTDAGGGFAPHPDPEIAAPWPAPPLNNIVARLGDSENVLDIRRFITETVKAGRPGTPMPAWGAFYGGAMNDQQIERIVDYILSIQTGQVPEPQAFTGASGEEIFDVNCARCHGEDASGELPGGGTTVGPSLLDEFARFGAAEDPAAARAAVRDTIVEGRILPTGANMPAWGDALTPDAIDRIVEYLESIQEEQAR